MEEHRLQGGFTLWCMKRTKVSKPAVPSDYEKSIKPVGKFSTAEEFWHVAGRLNRVTDVPFNADFHLFRDGVKPIWEDPINKMGGKLSFRVTKTKNELACARMWENLMIGFVGEYLDPGIDQVCGVIVSIRNTEMIFSIWNRDAEDLDLIAELKERTKSLLGIPHFVKLDYKRHLNTAK